MAPLGRSITEIARVPVAAATATVVDPDSVGSCEEVAVIVAVPPITGVKTPVLLIVPILAGPTDQVTPEL